MTDLTGVSDGSTTKDLNGVVINDGKGNLTNLTNDIDYNSILYILKDDGVPHTDFTGEAFMQYDGKGKATFRGRRSCSIKSGENIAKWRLAVTLPDGYTFGTGNVTKVYLDDSGGYVNDTPYIPVKYDGNKMYYKIENNYSSGQGYQTWYLFTSKYGSKNIVTTWNVIKI